MIRSSRPRSDVAPHHVGHVCRPPNAVGPALRATLAAACGALLACASRSGALHPGRIDGPPGMEALPDADVPEQALSERMRFGLQLAAESFAVAAPAPPPSRRALDLEDWSDGPLRAWIERKTRAIEAARRELDAAAEESHRQRIVGGAVVGLMYEDVARVLSSVPVPEDLDDEPDILAAYRDVIRMQVRPFLETARRAYHACAANATEPPGMRHWSRFCRGRLDGLPGADEPTAGDTRVEVLPDDE